VAQTQFLSENSNVRQIGLGTKFKNRCSEFLAIPELYQRAKFQTDRTLNGAGIGNFVKFRKKTGPFSFGAVSAKPYI